MAQQRIIVHRLERHPQPVEVFVDGDLPASEQARQAREIVADGGGEDVGEMEYHSTDDTPSNWSVYKDDKQIG